MDLIRGDWYSPAAAGYHTGCVYLNDVALQEATQLSQVIRAAGPRPLWYAQVDGNTGGDLIHLAWLEPARDTRVSATNPSWRYGGITAAGSDGVACAANIMADNLLRLDQVDFGAGTTSMGLHVSTNNNAAQIEIRLDTLDGPLLGVCNVHTSGWTDWKTYTATIAPVSGRKNVCLVFKNPAIALGNTTIYAQFPGVDPNQQQVEINVRHTVFYPEKTGVNYLTVSGFTLKNAACNWAPPSAEQRAVIGVNWSKGWVIEQHHLPREMRRHFVGKIRRRIRQYQCRGRGGSLYADGAARAVERVEQEHGRQPPGQRKCDSSGRDGIVRGDGLFWRRKEPQQSVPGALRKACLWHGDQGLAKDVMAATPLEPITPAAGSARSSETFR